ncbi:MAG: twin-arginine translocase TatA/TatE family subunit [Nitrospinae bacterium]|nr:twin-arginine translocase TatA/TatE family subunit [Nitrospinota bacterium]
MMGIGFPELMIILVIIMIIFGAGKLPEIGNAFGKSIKNFKQSMKEAEQEGLEVADAATGDQPAGQVEEGKEVSDEGKELSDEEKERLAREKAQAEGDAKDQAMKDEAQAFTDSLPRKGSYDYAKDEANKKA